jgi:hypothetical protein
MDVVVMETADAVVIAVTDYGEGMNSADTRIRIPSMGVGLAMMRAQSSNLEIESDTSGTIVTLHFQRAHPSATDVVWADVPADGGVPPKVLLSRSRLARECKRFEPRLYPMAFARCRRKGVEPVISGESQRVLIWAVTSVGPG